MTYFNLVKTNFIKGFNYKMNYFFSIILLFLPLTINYFVWSSINISSTNYRNIYDIVLYYTLCYFITAFTHTRTANNINYDYKKGNMILKKILPLNYFYYYLFFAVGNSLFQILFVSMPLFLTAMIFVRNKLYAFSFDLTSILLFMVSLTFSFLISFIIMYLIGILSFKFKENFGFIQLNYFLTILFSGSLIPLDLTPVWFQKIAEMLPYKYIVYSTIKMLFKYELLSFKIRVVVTQLIIVLILWSLRSLFETRLNKNIEILGG